ncbi:hypothetical protein NBRC3188_1059 [Acetobacter pasteurianus NBRC 3188]|uniref:Uncharacterized protein n=1 Tax=Acetobacter pasteurianus NBRC 3188 TaxID=1226663 RepID=A0A401WSR3_ACEPA|nr:hypothetical protein NBRC3188_1059 [Acetobacter pasteurianus NBRC 3188]
MGYGHHAACKRRYGNGLRGNALKLGLCICLRRREGAKSFQMWQTDYTNTHRAEGPEESLFRFALACDGKTC